MLFSQKRNIILLIKQPKQLGFDNKHDTNGWVNFSLILKKLLKEKNASFESFLLYPDEPFM